MNRTPWTEHGPLRVCDNGHYLEHADGTGFFWLGDTAWRLVSLSPQDVTRYLEDRAAKGFNVILFVATGLGRATYDGARPFVGEGKPYTSVDANEAYWTHVDYIVAEAARLGLYAAMFAWWGPDADSMFAEPHTHNFEYGRMLGERYGDAPNILWVGSGEYHKPFMWTPLSDEHTSNLVRVAEGIRAGDAARADRAARHLLTMHPLSFLSSSEEFHDAGWLDFNMVQTHVYHDYIDHLVYGDWQRTPAKPTVNAEPWYEGEEELFERRTGVQKVPPQDGRTFDTAWIQRYQAYWSVFFGGIGYTYGHMNLWMMSDIYELYTHANWGATGVLLQSALDAPGSAHLMHLRTLMQSKPIQARVPDPELISLNTRGSDGTLSPDLRCATRDADGAWAMVYTTKGMPVRLHMRRLATGQARAYWYNPRTGKWRAGEDDCAVEHDAPAPFATGIPSGPGAPDRYFDPPGEWADGNDWALVLEVE